MYYKRSFIDCILSLGQEILNHDIDQDISGASMLSELLGTGVT